MPQGSYTQLVRHAREEREAGVRHTSKKGPKPYRPWSRGGRVLRATYDFFRDQRSTHIAKGRDPSKQMAERHGKRYKLLGRSYKDKKAAKEHGSVHRKTGRAPTMYTGYREMSVLGD